MVLFDIDGTLLVDSSSHLEYLIAALCEATGKDITVTVVDETPLIGGRNCSGFTDRQVVEAFVGTDADKVDDVLDRYATSFETDVVRGAVGCGSTVEGAERVLEGLVADGAAVGLSTGNAARVAEAKMRAAGLAHWFDFTDSLGFGTVHNHRDKLIAAGKQALSSDTPSTVFVIGDTNRDMSGAVENGAYGVGVLTGSATEAALYEAGATTVLRSVAELYRELAV